MVLLVSSRHETENSRSHAVDLEQVLVLDLEALAVQHRVVGLLADGAHEAEALGNLARLADLRRAPLGRAPVKGFALCVALVEHEKKGLTVNDVVERAHSLLHGHSGVSAVRKDDVDWAISCGWHGSTNRSRDRDAQAKRWCPR